MEEKEDIGTKEKRIRNITAFYYTNPKVQQALVDFAAHREVVPRYFEGFGKRPDMLQYFSDIRGLVKKGATSFHASEELWEDPLQLNSDMNPKEMSALRKGWDLLIDIDSPFLDCSKIAAELIIKELEKNGVKNYGIKFSGSKGFHLMISNKAFPKEFDGMQTKDMFPEWPRAICGYLMENIRKEYNLRVGSIVSTKEVEKRTKLKAKDLEAVRCGKCGKKAIKGALVKYNCPVCGLTIDRKDVKISKRRLKCLNADCAGVLESHQESEYYYCEDCLDPNNEKTHLNSQTNPELFEAERGISAELIASLDLVLVAPRHLFRMPYSLHEKTTLASVVLTKEELAAFDPNMADPMKIQIRNYIPENTEGEARKLLAAAIDWKRGKDIVNQEIEERRYKGKKLEGKAYENAELKDVPENVYPPAIKKLLNGLEDGRKRGLFVLLTFFKSINVPPQDINNKVRAWNEKNTPPLKEGYVRSQVEWHLKQTKKILPPNYSNDAFYRDIGILDKKPDTKNPLVDVGREMRRKG